MSEIFDSEVRASAIPRNNFDNLRLANQVKESDGSTWQSGPLRRAGEVADVGRGVMDNDKTHALEQESFSAQYEPTRAALPDAESC